MIHTYVTLFVVLVQECFLFSVYTSVYQYGACRAWLDEDHTNVTALMTQMSWAHQATYHQTTTTPPHTAPGSGTPPYVDWNDTAATTLPFLEADNPAGSSAVTDTPVNSALIR